MTILELANELNITKQGLTKRLKDMGLFGQLYKQGNKFIVPDDIANEVREAFTKKKPTVDNSELAFLRAQIEEKDKQIAKLQAALDQEQKLHAIDNQALQLAAEAVSRRSFWDRFRRKKE